MKKIITGMELQEKIETAIGLLCGTVKKTLGPKGNNVIIDSSTLAPYITNDGVTIAENIESDDEGVRAILDLAKEASFKTNEMVGDGTTTTLVLLEALYFYSIDYMKQGKHPVFLKQELNRSFEEIETFLEDCKQPINKILLQNIANVSANDETIGKLVFDAFQIVSNKSAIIIEEDTCETSLTPYQGYYFSTTLVSSYFLRSQKALEFQNTYLVLFQSELLSMEPIECLLNEIMSQNRSVIIIAERFSDLVTETFVSLSLDGKLNCCLLTLEEYGLNKLHILRDLEVLSCAEVIDKDLSIGQVTNVVIQSNFSRILFENHSKIEERIAEIKKDILEKKDDFYQDFYEKRLAMFTNGLAKIKISAATTTECREKRMRLDDAICAVSTSQSGILPGGGLSLLKIANQLNDESIGNLIWKKALEKPFLQILENAGIDSIPILEKIKEDKWTTLYNVSKEKFEPLSSTNVVDPYDVVLYSLRHAVSIACMLLTTTSLVINEKKSLPESPYSSL